MSTLFKEAIADARQLRTAAETNAKNKILESITPRIRALIEQELMDDDLGAATELDMESLIDDEDDMTSTPHIDIDVAGDATITMSSDIDVESVDDESTEFETVDLEEPLMTLNNESARALARLIKNPTILSEVGLERRVNDLSIKVKRFNRLLDWAEIDQSDVTLRESACKHYTQLLKEVISLRDQVIFTKRAQNKNEIRSGFNEILKEIKKMSRRHAESLFDKLFENRQQGLNELDVVLSDEDLEALGVEDPGGVNVGDLEAVVSMSGEEVEEEVEGEEPIDLGELDLILTDDDLDVLGVEEPESVDVSSLDVSVELDGGEEEDVEVDEESEETFEIDEAVLRRELRRMRRLREQGEAADADPYLAHGGQDEGDVLVDVDEEDLINALADELGDPSVPTPTVESRRRPRRASQARATRRNVSGRNTNNSKKLVEYKRAVVALKNQLTEMNLFNAKLLYVNKLMQNRNLTTKQQRAIVEAIDNAKTLREAKLLYKSLTTSLKKRSTLREGRRTLGSSSRSTRTAAPAKKSGEVDRWAVLAGIDNNK
tara:strand:+ start:3943 stop:5583 length:1641 start_codon:yes stop_codon:yes gene_type:complete